MKKPDLIIFNNFRFLDTATEKEKVPFLNDPENSAIIGLPKNRDMSYGEAISVSSYANANGYYFSNEFLLQNYGSLLYKPMNVGHSKNKIIGVIYDTAIIGQDSEEIVDIKNIHFDFEGKPINLDEGLDVYIKFALFNWLFPETVEEIKKGTDSDDPENAKYKVSMEIWPIKYGYNFDKDESTFVNKSEDNEFLDKYVGLTYKGKYVSRQYIEGDFAGTGFVQFPANDRSLVLDLSTIEDTTKQLLQAASRDASKSDEQAYFIDNNIVIENTKAKDKENKINTENNANMDNLTKEEVEKIISDKFSAIEAQINTAMANDKALEQQTAREKILTQEIANSTREVVKVQEQLNQANQSLTISKTAHSELTKSIEEAEVEKTALNAKVEKLEKELNEASETIHTFKQKEVGESRIAELAKINVVYSEEKKVEKIDRLGLMSDEAWNEHYADMKDLNLKAPNKADDKIKPEGEEEPGGEGNDPDTSEEVPPTGSPDSAGVLSGEQEPITPAPGNARTVMSLVTPRGQKAFDKTGTEE